MIYRDLTPTEKDLDRLLNKKGQEALVWYIWRSTLRILPLLGFKSLKHTWKKKTIKNLFAVCRIPIVLANTKYLQTETVEKLYRTAMMASDATEDIIAGKLAEASAYTIGLMINASPQNAYAISDIISSIAFNIHNDTPNAFTSAKTLDTAARMDYEFLLSSPLSYKDYWFSQPLWGARNRVLKREINKPKLFDEYQNRFIKELLEFNLDFLADDLLYLWERKSTQVKLHWNNYSQELSEEVLNETNSFREAILFGSEEINAVRILLLGPGGAGKSTLAERLKNEEITLSRKATVGIDYLNHEPLNLNKNEGAFVGLEIPEELQLYLWDFGGQTLFYGLHKAFLHENCVYVLVVDSRHEQAPDDWLHQIKHIAGINSSPPVLLVSNEYENCRNQQNERRLLREFGDNLQFFYFPCNSTEHPELRRFKQELLNTASKSRYSITKSLLDSINQIDNLFKTQPVISRLTLENKLTQSVPSRQVEVTLEQLQGLGRLIPISIEEDKYCLNPAWAVDHAYQLLYLDSLLQSDGKIKTYDLMKSALNHFSSQDIKKSSTYSVLNEENIRDLLNFLKSCRVCVSLDRNNLFFSDVTAANEPEKIFDDFYKNKEFTIRVEFHLPYIPIGLSARLVHRWLGKDTSVWIESTSNIWREGFILKHKKSSTARAILQYQPRKAIIIVNCIGNHENLADILITLWFGITEEVRPIEPEQIIPMLRIDQRFFDPIDYGKRPLVEATQWLCNRDTIIDMIKQLEVEMKSNKTEYHFHSEVKQSQFSSGKNIVQKQDNRNSFIKISNDEKDILLSIIKLLHKTDISSSQRKILIDLESQVENSQLEENWYHKLLPHISTAADISTIGATIAQILWN